MKITDKPWWTLVYGRLMESIWIIQEGSIEDIKREVLRQIKVGKRNGKFIVSTGSPITPQTPISKVRAFVEITRQLVN